MYSLVVEALFDNGDRGVEKSESLVATSAHQANSAVSPRQCEVDEERSDVINNNRKLRN